jgi:hypothetical protein
MAEEAKQLYVTLRDSIRSELRVNGLVLDIDQPGMTFTNSPYVIQNLDSQFTLVQDVWTTKGNAHAFSGVTVCFITSNWEYKVRHLTLKTVAWHHHGQWLAEPIVTILKKDNLYKKISNFDPFISSKVSSCTIMTNIHLMVLHACSGD